MAPSGRQLALERRDFDEACQVFPYGTRSALDAGAGHYVLQLFIPTPHQCGSANIASEGKDAVANSQTTPLARTASVESDLEYVCR